MTEKTTRVLTHPGEPTQIHQNGTEPKVKRHVLTPLEVIGLNNLIAQRDAIVKQIDDAIQAYGFVPGSIRITDGVITQEITEDADAS